MGKLKEIAKRHISLETRVRLTKIASKILSKPFRYVSEVYEGVFNKYSKNIPAAKKGWSVVVLTSGKNKEGFDKFVLAAYEEFKGMDNYEIVVVGPPNLDLSYFEKNIKFVLVPFYELNIWKVPFAISKKKNFGVKHAEYDKVVVSHDYLYFHEGWKKGYDEFGDFSVCTNVVLNQDGTRHMDWVVWDYPEVGIGLLPYSEECTQYQVIGGNYFVVKRDFFIENPMNENLRWGESEDIDWGFSIRNKTKFRVNPKSKVQYLKYKKGVVGSWLEGTKKLEVIFGQKII